MIFDFHNDYITGYIGRKCVREYILENNDAKTIFAIWTTQLKNPDKVIKLCNKLSKQEPNFLYGIEDLGFLAKKHLKIFDKITPFYCSLTWNYENALAGGCNCECGLKQMGKDIIHLLNERGIVLDAAHLCEKSFYESAEIAKNFICSHTGLKSIKGCGRNIDFNQISLILEKEGIVGLSPVGSFMRSSNVLAYADTITEYCSKFGTKGLVIGTDFYGATPILGFVSYRDKAELYSILKRRGFSENDISAIFFLNAQNYVNKLL